MSARNGQSDTADGIAGLLAGQDGPLPVPDLLPQGQAALLAVWGQRDPFFAPAGAQAYLRDNPNAEVHLFDAGHFALETHGDEIIPVIERFLDRVFAKRP